MTKKILSFFRLYREILFWIALGAAFDAGFLLIRDAPLVGDEGFHAPQIHTFMRGSDAVSPHLTTLPIYHAIMAGLLTAVGADSVAEARLMSFLGSAAGIWFFYLLVRRVHPEERHLRTAQFVFLPILFPLHFLIYTDAWALALVILAVERALADRPWQSAAAISAAILMRQPNIVWAGFIWMILVEPSLRQPAQALKSDWPRHTLPSVLVFLGFCAFVFFNGGIAIGDRRHHELCLNLANIWFFGLCFFLLFLPDCVKALVLAWNRMAGRPALTLLAATGILTGYLLTYHATHPYNQPPLWFYLRNRLLHATSRIFPIKLLAFLPVMAGLLGFLLAPMGQRRFKLLVPLTLLSIGVMPLIEQRYYLVPMSLFLVFRRSTPLLWEKINTAFYITASFLLLYGTSRGKFFL